MTYLHDTSEHQTLTQCCFNVGPTSWTVSQHQNNIGAMSCFCHPVHTRRGPNVDLTLARSLRQRPSINPTLGQRLVLAGNTTPASNGSYVPLNPFIARHDYSSVRSLF